MSVMLTAQEEAQLVVFDDLVEIGVPQTKGLESGPPVECVDATYCPEANWTP